jgi:cell division protein FtsW
MLSDNVIYNFYYAWWKKIDKTIFLLIIFLFGLGLFFSLVSTSLIASDKLNTNNYFFFFKHLIYICLGILILIFFSSLNKKTLFTLSILLFFISLFFLFLVPIIGTEVNGSRRWLDLFFLPRFQPIELVKPFAIIFIAIILSSEKNYNIYYKYFISFMVIVPIFFLLMMQPDIGQTLLIFLSWLTLVFISGISLTIFFNCFYCFYFYTFLSYFFCGQVRVYKK